MKKYLTVIILIFSFICTLTAFCNDVGFRFTELEDIDRCFISLDIRERNHGTVIPLDNGEFISVSKNIYLPNKSKRMVTDIVLEYKDSTAVIPNVEGDILKFKRLRTNGGPDSFWYGSSYGLGNHKRTNGICIIGIHKGNIRVYMDDRNLYGLGYNAGEISSANDLFIATDGSLVLNPFESMDIMNEKQAKLIWNENGFDISIGNYRKDLVISKKLSSWPYYRQ